MYHLELKKRWGFLRCCKNHWKVDMLATANYSQWYLTHKAKMVAIKAAKQGEASKARAPKQAKTAVEEDDDLCVCFEFTANPDNLGSLRSETLMDNFQVSNNQLSEAKDKVP